MRTTFPRSARMFAALVVAGGIATGIAGAAAASTAAVTSGGHHSSVLTFTAKTVQDDYIDVGTPGPGVGDQIVSSDTVLIKGKAVGTDGVICTVVKATDTALTCQWVMTMDLPGGQLTLQGIADGPTGPPTSPLSFSLAVTGGTGQFRGAAGTADIVDNPGGVEKITIRLGY